MNYGDGWYGGVYIGAMYALAFVSGDIEYITTEALKTIPEKSTYYQCINDVIKWHKQFPDDWHRTWFEIQRKWSSDIACHEGIFQPFNIDAKVNSAYVVLGLLYGKGDFSKSLDIATRAGQDADCNPSSVGGILGTVLGYDKIPQRWKMGLKDAEDINFKYTDISLNKVYNIGLKHALSNIQSNGGKVENNNVTIKLQLPTAVKLEQGFSGQYPIARTDFNRNIKEASFEFDGTGFSLAGEARKKSGVTADYVFEAELFIDGQKIETAKLPTNFTTRRLELFSKHSLENKRHKVTVKLLNPNEQYELRSFNYVVFSDKPISPAKL